MMAVITLPETNALRGCERIETWHVHVGKRGRLEKKRRAEKRAAKKEEAK